MRTEVGLDFIWGNDGNIVEIRLQCEKYVHKVQYYGEIENVINSSMASLTALGMVILY